MSPLPQEHLAPQSEGPERPLSGEEIVVSGMAGLLPGCTSIEEFVRKLYKKVNLVKETPPRWNFAHPEIPTHCGLISGLEWFDAQYFSVNHRLANTVDPMSRKLLELSYAAILDAGVPPVELNGKRVGVFLCTSLCEAEQASTSESGHDAIAGTNRTMFANRISYYLNLLGPSMMLDSFGCGGLLALEKAQQAMQQGVCESAIVGASKLLLHPQSVMHHGRTLHLAKDGETRSYDKNGDGHAMSEAIHVVFLQKRKDAKRSYATLCHVQTGFNKLQRQEDYEYGFFREPESLEAFLHEFYGKLGVSPSSVEYVEGVGAGDVESDTAELDVFDKVFAKDRRDPLLVGSVTSNVGYTDAASGLSSLAKVLLAYQTGSIAANLHCDDPVDIEAVKNGSIRIVTEEQKFDRGYTAVNSCSLAGAMGHALLKGHYIPKVQNKYDTEMPYLVAVSGRHDQAVSKIFDWIKLRPIDPEEISLINSFHKHVIKLHMSRGFALYSKVANDIPQVLKMEVEHYDDVTKPLWFVYSGMGSQWVGMGKELMKIPVFADAIKRCDKVLSEKGIDIVDLITTTETPVFDNILNSFVGIAAVQIGITDVLRTMGILPDNIIGHSVGELCCGYADGCLTAEETILLAYYRGLVSLETDFIKGSMAAVGLGYKQISKLLPPEIDVACHNSAESSTISGPAAVMQEFVSKLTSQGIFAKEVACSNIAYHSRYIAIAADNLLKYCESVIKTPKLRSDRWVSTSVPQELWEVKAKYSSPEYHVNNLLSPVLFEETSQLIPSNAVLIEIAPHSLLQAILKRSNTKDFVYIPLTRRGHPDNAACLLEGIGRLYQKGFSMDINALYPKIEYPVSTETSNLSHLVEWAHTEERSIFPFKQPKVHQTTTYNPIVTLHNEEHQHLRGYSQQGKNVLPHAAILNFVWETLAMTIKVRKDLMSVKFENVHFYSQPIITETTLLRLSCQMQRVSGHFEVIYEEGIIADGYLNLEDTQDTHVEVDQIQVAMDVDSTAIYRLLFERGYQFRGDFQVINKSNKHLNHAEIQMNGNWVTFIDGLLQMLILRNGYDGVVKIEHIHKLSINNKNFCENDKTSIFKFRYCQLENIARCGPVKIENVTFKNIPCTSLCKPTTRHQQYIPFDQHATDYDESTNLYLLMQIVSENIHKSSINVIEIKCTGADSATDIIERLMNSPLDKQLKKTVVNQDLAIKLDTSCFDGVDVVVLNKIDSEAKMFEVLYKLLPRNIFIVNIAYHTDAIYPTTLYKIVASARSEHEGLELAIWRQILPISTTAITVKSSSQFAFLRETHANLHVNHKLLVFTCYPPPVGFKEVITELRTGGGCRQVVAVVIDGESSQDNFEETANFDLAFNILRKGKWGGEYYLPECHYKSNAIGNVTLQCLSPGDLNSLSWIDNAPQNSTAGIPVQVYFAGLNMFDARVASAEIIPKTNTGFGMDFSGVTKNGVHVMGLVKSHAASLEVSAEPELLWPVPTFWTLEDAATVPLPYCLAFYCLGIVTKLYPHQNVFVHGGAGAVGQAVISIALAHGCNVFTTVSDMQKKRFLKRLFPDLPAAHIGNSRDDTFSDMVLLETQGRGCEIVISSVRSNLRNATLKCCASFGTTIDLVQIHTRENFDYGMSYLTRERSYVPIDFAAIFEHEKSRYIVQKLHSMVSEGIKLGYVRPLSRVTLAAREAARGLRLLAASRHRGRVLLNMKTFTPDNFVPKVFFSPDKYKVVICDEQELGLQFIDKLIKNGAKKLIVHTMKPSSILDFKKETWNGLDANVKLYHTSLIDKSYIKALFDEASDAEGIDGIYIISMEPNSYFKDVIADVDGISRGLSLPLRHFAIITQDHQLGYETYTNRMLNGLPSTRIELCNPETFEAREGAIMSRTLSYKSALEAIMSTLGRDSSVLIYADATGDMLDEISKVTGNELKSINDKTSLEDLGIDGSHAQFICNIIQNKLGIYLDKCAMSKMTVGRLKSLEAKPKYQPAESLERYFSYIDTDEVEANCDFFTMKSFMQRSFVCFDEFNMDAPYLCVVPGLEGHHSRFSQLCEQLKVRAVVLQPGFDRPADSVDDIAERLVEVMEKKLSLKNEFYLLGYEFGAEVALRMAHILEKSGMTGTVYMLGGDLEEIKTTIVSQLNYNTEDELQNKIVQLIFNKFNKNDAKEITRKLKLANNWEDKTQICILMLRRNAKQSSQYIRDLLETTYSRIKMLAKNNNNTELHKSKIVLIRGNVVKKLPDGIIRKLYGDDVTVHDIDAELPDLPVDLRVPNFINKYLSRKVVEEYEKANRCETVLLNELAIII